MSDSPTPDTKAAEKGKKLTGSTKSTWLSFLKSIATFTGDLSSLTAPSFILSSTSLIEYTAYWAEHPQLFISLPNGKTALERHVLVTKWFASTLKNQYAGRNERYGTEKKPLNPILGEEFIGKWATQCGDTRLVAEQVSHHPPISAYCIYNKKCGIRLEGYNGNKSSFTGPHIHVRQTGHARLTLENLNEVYYITFPMVVLEGLWYGAPYIELSKKSYIFSNTGYMSTIEYSGRGYFTGKRNTFKASISELGRKTEPLYQINGSWTGQLYIKDCSLGKEAEPELFLDCKNFKPINIQVAPIEEQSDLESRKIWHDVAVALDSGDYSTASREKSVIEERQRALRKQEKANEEPWKTRYFNWCSEDREFASLSSKCLKHPFIEGYWQFTDAESN
ncbi:oxysterol binding protein [Schizosaccharomyces japonicus yFS275]|uniref:Oxysterol binding protein n=1 Tax=Schizosaccharomyces japonicus (strain yFS275 / FY16936) TaxID=402676 RepID=B6JYD0_SCHJY|nr:oxysterol binding protein [Schizosaccharomyces japonicus yFS275]EEB06548.2 oxysterol binding protein [Schizosaccharomyces japonicus yFS275]